MGAGICLSCENMLNWINKFNLGLFDASIFKFLDGGEPTTQEWEEMATEFLSLYDIYARKNIKTATTTTTQIEKAHYLVQKDTSGDGIADIEFSYEQTFASISAEINTREKTSIYFQDNFRSIFL